MNVDDDDEFVLARLEEKMADVREENVDALVGAKWRLVADTILVNLDLAGHSLSFHGRADEDII
jgi:hypothetical protein